MSMSCRIAIHNSEESQRGSSTTHAPVISHKTGEPGLTPLGLNVIYW
jgi:hypothetical protein